MLIIQVLYIHLVRMEAATSEKISYLIKGEQKSQRQKLAHFIYQQAKAGIEEIKIFEAFKIA